VPIGLAHGAERDLGDLRAATDHDDPLAEHASQRPGDVDRPTVRAPRAPRPARPRLTPSTSSSISASGGSPRRGGPWPAPGSGRRSASTAGDARDASALSTTSKRIAAASAGRCRSARHQPSEPRPAAPGRRSLTDIESAPARRSDRAPRTGAPRPRTRRASRPGRRSSA
jgi:hypothetical protein